MAKSDPLKDYRIKRRFDRTPEPSAQPAPAKAKAKRASAKRVSPKRVAEPKRAAEPKRVAEPKRIAGPKRAAEPKRVAAPKRIAGPKRAAGPERIFVVQMHDATTLHYDVRLEVSGVLKSWAVPKGPSLDPRQKRLAMPTEDHPMEYATFEGNIPQGHYGAGPVLVWDAGVYRNLKTDSHGKEIPMDTCLQQGRVEVHLTGKKLLGGFALVRTAADKQGRFRWLMIKMKDAHADPDSDIIKDQGRSVLSGRTIRQVQQRR